MLTFLHNKDPDKDTLICKYALNSEKNANNGVISVEHRRHRHRRRHRHGGIRNNGKVLNCGEGGNKMSGKIKNGGRNGKRRQQMIRVQLVPGNWSEYFATAAQVALSFRISLQSCTFTSHVVFVLTDFASRHWRIS